MENRIYLIAMLVLMAAICMVVFSIFMRIHVAVG